MAEGGSENTLFVADELIEACLVLLTWPYDMSFSFRGRDGHEIARGQSPGRYGRDAVMSFVLVPNAVTIAFSMSEQRDRTEILVDGNICGKVVTDFWGRRRVRVLAPDIGEIGLVIKPWILGPTRLVSSTGTARITRISSEKQGTGTWKQVFRIEGGDRLDFRLVACWAVDVWRSRALRPSGVSS